MKKLIAMTIASVMLLVMPAAGADQGSGSGGSGGDGDVIREGMCGGRSDWKLKLGPEDGGTEIEFEVDQNVVGDTWRIRVHRDGTKVFMGRRTTRGPSGSFELEIVRANPAGSDSYVARAVNLRSGERCTGQATI